MSQNLPLFYRDLSGFDAIKQGKLSFPEVPPHYRYAAQTSVIPLLIHEVPLALRTYPLVFLPGQDDAPLSLVVMVGIGDNNNRFVDANGHWRENTYVPAWVRRYPFLSVKAAGSADVVLAIDPTADWLHTEGGEALMQDGKPTARMERVIAFQKEFEEYARRTQAAVQAIAEAGILEPGSLKFQAPGAQADGATEVKGFLIVSETRLRALSDESVLKLHKADALGLIYAQLFSLNNLGNLLPESAPPAHPKSGKTSHK